MIGKGEVTGGRERQPSLLPVLLTTPAGGPARVSAQPRTSASEAILAVPELLPGRGASRARRSDEEEEEGGGGGSIL